jgi:hypothetical protein
MKPSGVMIMGTNTVGTRRSYGHPGT